MIYAVITLGTLVAIALFFIFLLIRAMFRLENEMESMNETINTNALASMKLAKRMGFKLSVKNSDDVTEYESE